MSGFNIATVERKLVALSRSERKAAIEQLQQLVREISFDLAAGVSHEVGCCPRCGGLEFIKKGKSADGSQRYFCHGCGRTFGIKTANAIAMSKLPVAKWMLYIECFVNMLSLRACAQKCSISLKSAFCMRHRLLEVIKKFCPVFSVDAGVSAELDETYFAESFKGNHTNSSTFTMPRPAHKRGRVRRPNSEQICVLSGVNDKGAAFFELAGRGNISKARAMSTLKGKVKDGSIISTDKAGAYPSVLHELNVAVHNRYDANPHKRLFLGKGSINRINAVHSNLKGFMRRFRGVSTKHLHSYLDWMRWCMDFASNMSTATETVSEQLGKGTYQTKRAGFSHMPQLYMDYWQRA